MWVYDFEVLNSMAGDLITLSEQSQGYDTGTE
jgi:hypothetical protein